MLRLHDPHANDEEPPLRPQFAVGQCVRHIRYNYRGLIVSMDARCKAPDTWYVKNKTQPLKNQTWYHLLVHDTPTVTYAAHSSLEVLIEEIDIRHPLLKLFFEGREKDIYIRNKNPWPNQV
jgi:heat shock protein HspQ